MVCPVVPVSIKGAFHLRPYSLRAKGINKLSLKNLLQWVFMSEQYRLTGLTCRHGNRELLIGLQKVYVAELLAIVLSTYMVLAGSSMLRKYELKVNMDLSALNLSTAL